MMLKIENLKRIEESGIVAVVRAESSEQALKIAEAVKAGGVKAIEITMTVPGAVEVIRDLAQTYQKNEILSGAGTVLDAETARICLLAGAEYIVSPVFDIETIKLCNRYQKIVIPGAMSVTEVLRAMEAGADVVKIFPAELFGPKIIEAIKGPLPQAPLLPTGEFNFAESEVVAVVDFDLEVAREAAEELNTNDYYTNFEEALIKSDFNAVCIGCLLYTSDAADEEDSVDLGGRRIIKKKKKNK